MNPQKAENPASLRSEHQRAEETKKKGAKEKEGRRANGGRRGNGATRGALKDRAMYRWMYCIKAALSWTLLFGLPRKSRCHFVQVLKLKLDVLRVDKFK